MKCIASAFAFTLFFGLIGIFLIPSSVIYILYYPFLKYPEDKFQYLSSRIYRIFFMVLPKIKLSVSLKENLPDSAVYVSTHLSHFDYPILGSFIERYIIMTRLNFRKIPLISTIGKLIGIRYLDKDNLNNISHVYDEFRKNLQENRNVIFFAEGTRGNGVELGRFKRGAFRLAYDTNKPIVPIILLNTEKVLEKGKFCFSTLNSVNIKAIALDPIYPNKFLNENEMLRFTHKLMQEEISNV